MESYGVVPKKIEQMWKDCQGAGDVLARVSAGYTDLYRVNTESGSCLAELSGSYRYTLQGAEDLPVTGDWVVIDRESDEQGHAIIHYLFPRISQIERTASGSDRHEKQLLAANVDMIGICMALNRDYNLRRLERYLTLVWNSGAVPLVILTKTDLCVDLSARISEVEASAVGVNVITTTVKGKDGFSAIDPYLKADRTLAFIGSSGVGKSTLINYLLGSSFAAARGLRGDGKGRHTTT
ncbi:MAG: GTPase RsgA, partial [Spirochaetales bacterium]|nr:GTPase RsgA [Spirochaetales bacterium]